MAAIPRKYIENYTKSLNALSADVQKRLSDDLAKIDFTADVAAIRDAVIGRMEFYLGPYTDMAAAVAAEFYDGIRGISVGEKIGALAESGRESIATEGAVRGIMQDVVDGKAAAVVIRKLVDRADYEVKKAAGECIYRNGKRDPLKPKYARVPSGGETCRFCIMLASRGFVYHNAKQAGDNGHYHANCDCRIVPGFGDSPSVAGYDPGKLYDQWKTPEKHANVNEIRVRESILPSVDPSMVNSYTVNREVVNRAAFRQRFEKINLPKPVRGALYNNSVKILKEMDGTPNERLVYLDKRTGNLIASTYGDAPRKLLAELSSAEREKLLQHTGEHVILHNHPGSTYPSLSDIFSASKNRTACSVIACHDGDLFVIECTKYAKGYVDGRKDVTRLQEIIYNHIDEAKKHTSSESEANLVALMTLEKVNGGNKWYKITKISE